MLDLLSVAVEHDDDEIIIETEEMIHQAQLALAADVHGGSDETGAAYWDTSMAPQPWPSKRMLQPSNLDEVQPAHEDTRDSGSTVQRTLAYCQTRSYDSNKMELLWTDESGRAILPQDIEWMEGCDRSKARAEAIRHFERGELRRVKAYNKEVAIAAIQHRLVWYVENRGEEPPEIDHPSFFRPYYAAERLEAEVLGIRAAVKASRDAREWDFGYYERFERARYWIR
ncbi:hypothetical protein NLU13_9055 [Sarocladium strictum]|uniref:Uncharacterized protein n=1 Tax=Sarocladium strictum TaxID=5046 RepID=A0AA39GBM8_SARSR|nr:hypothetical protein NLU13_9055 [Sarocladium strictum]